MPSFDIVSEVDLQEIRNAVDQTNREVNSRFDFKESNAKAEYLITKISLMAQNEFQLNQLLDILKNKLAKRGIALKNLTLEKITKQLNQVSQDLTIQQGIHSILAKKLLKLIKDSKIKVQAAIQEDQIRVTGKKRNDLQQIITLLKTAEADLELPLQFINFRD